MSRLVWKRDREGERQRQRERETHTHVSSNTHDRHTRKLKHSNNTHTKREVPSSEYPTLPQSHLSACSTRLQQTWHSLTQQWFHQPSLARQRHVQLHQPPRTQVCPVQTFRQTFACEPVFLLDTMFLNATKGMGLIGASVCVCVCVCFCASVYVCVCVCVCVCLLLLSFPHPSPITPSPIFHLSHTHTACSHSPILRQPAGR